MRINVEVFTDEFALTLIDSFQSYKLSLVDKIIDAPHLILIEGLSRSALSPPIPTLAVVCVLVIECLILTFFDASSVELEEELGCPCLLQRAILFDTSML